MFINYHDKINNQNKQIIHHVAIIMDGNGRWAKNKGKLKIDGYIEGVKSAKIAIDFALKNKFYALTLYAFSSENWRRSIKETNELLNLLVNTLMQEIGDLLKYNICLKIIGDLNCFNLHIKKQIHKVQEITKKNNKLMLNIAINYGGRWDIIQSTKKIVKAVQSGILSVNQITEDILNSYICLKELPPIDLLIRTGGEFRISNFLLWQIAYSELWFTKVLWPDFNEQIFQEAIKDFFLRERRYGGN